jgi:hypothetical protein
VNIGKSVKSTYIFVRLLVLVSSTIFVRFEGRLNIVDKFVRCEFDRLCRGMVVRGRLLGINLYYFWEFDYCIGVWSCSIFPKPTRPFKFICRTQIRPQSCD